MKGSCPDDTILKACNSFSLANSVNNSLGLGPSNRKCSPDVDIRQSLATIE